MRSNGVFFSRVREGEGVRHREFPSRFFFFFAVTPPPPRRTQNRHFSMREGARASSPSARPSAADAKSVFFNAKGRSAQLGPAPPSPRRAQNRHFSIREGARPGPARQALGPALPSALRRSPRRSPGRSPRRASGRSRTLPEWRPHPSLLSAIAGCIVFSAHFVSSLGNSWKLWNM